MESKPLLEGLTDEIESMLLNEFRQGAELSDKAMRTGLEVHPIERGSFLKLAPWLAVNPEITCFHVESVTLTMPEMRQTYTGGLLVFTDEKRIDHERIAQTFNMSGRVTFLRDLIAQPTGKPN